MKTVFLICGESSSGKDSLAVMLKHDGYFLDNESFIGQVISESDFNLLVSLVRKKVYDIEQITAINELRRLSRKQKPFTI